MSMIGRSKEADPSQMALAPRAVRVRNACLCAIARTRGLEEPADSDLAHLQAAVTLSAAVGWWEQVQGKPAAMSDADAPSFTSARSRVMIKAAAISTLVLFAILVFPRELAGCTDVVSTTIRTLALAFLTSTEYV